jgi:pimeloyl-ACP methyl ester carboxylesterase
VSELFCARGGPPAGPPLLLLHGLAATGEVFAGVARLAATGWPGPVVVPDLRGHGRSPHGGRYSLGEHAADVARLLDRSEPVTVLGHSMGGAVGIALASGWFGVRVAEVCALGVKVRWTAEELDRVAALAGKPAASFPSRERAAARFVKVAGLAGLAGADDPVTDSGIRAERDGWRLAADPRTNGVGAPDMAGLLAAARCPVQLARGEHDPLVTLADLRDLDPAAVELPGLGHNAQVEDPAAVLRLVLR